MYMFVQVHVATCTLYMYMHILKCINYVYVYMYILSIFSHSINLRSKFMAVII